jgi:hypothetical protein
MTLWQNYVYNNDEVDLAILVREQDGASIGGILTSLGALVGAIFTGGIAPAIGSGVQLAINIGNTVNSDDNQTVGAFAFYMKNEGGNVIYKWSAAPGFTAMQSPNNDQSTAEFSCTGEGGNYTVRAAVQTWMNIQPKQSGKSIDVANNSLLSGEIIQMFPFNGGNNQLWEVTPIGGGWNRIERGANDDKRHSGLCLDVADASMEDGADVNQYPWHGGYNQQWKIEILDDGWNRIVNRQSGKCLDVRGASTADHARVQQYEWNGGDNQRWKLW